jgi:hypothetical protein
MTTLPSLSERYERLSSRERRVLMAGALASVLIVLGALVVTPFVRDWRDREEAIAAKAEQLARLEALAASEEMLQQSAAQLRDALGRRSQKLLDGSTVALAGSALQSLVRSYGERSRVSILRMNPAAAGTGADDGGDGNGSADVAPIALSLTAEGDIYGLVDLLYYLQNGETLLVVDELRVNSPRGSRAGALMGWTLRLRGFYEPGGGA